MGPLLAWGSIGSSQSNRLKAGTGKECLFSVETSSDKHYNHKASGVLCRLDR